jgi:hypothetical protein
LSLPQFNVLFVHVLKLLTPAKPNAHNPAATTNPAPTTNTTNTNTNTTANNATASANAVIPTDNQQLPQQPTPLSHAQPPAPTASVNSDAGTGAGEIENDGGPSTVIMAIRPVDAIPIDPSTVSAPNTSNEVSQSAEPITAFNHANVSIAIIPEQSNPSSSHHSPVLPLSVASPASSPRSSSSPREVSTAQTMLTIDGVGWWSRIHTRLFHVLID